MRLLKAYANLIVLLTEHFGKLRVPLPAKHAQLLIVLSAKKMDQAAINAYSEDMVPHAQPNAKPQQLLNARNSACFWVSTSLRLLPISKMVHAQLALQLTVLAARTTYAQLAEKAIRSTAASALNASLAAQCAQLTEAAVRVANSTFKAEMTANLAKPPKLQVNVPRAIVRVTNGTQAHASLVSMDVLIAIAVAFVQTARLPLLCIIKQVQLHAQLILLRKLVQARLIAPS